MLKAVTSLAILFLCLPVMVTGATIHVPADQPTIQAGINAAADGDTVLVAAGTYLENIDFLGKAVTIESEQGIDVTTIDGNQVGSTVTFTNGEDSDSVLSGFTVTNGSTIHPAYGGGGIYCYYASPLITGNKITGNSTGTTGAGILTYGGGPTITNNIITSNISDNDGGGIACWQCSFPTITGNVISDNTADWGGGIFLRKASYPDISDNIITGNSADSYHGGGIYVWDVSSPNIANNIISDNFAGSDGGGICVYTQSSPFIKSNTITGNTAGVSGGAFCSKFSCGPTITNSILWGNAAPTGSEIHHDSTATPVVTYSDVQGGWTGTGNIDADPLFVNGSDGEYYLSQVAAGQPEDSPCVDTGDPASEMVEGTTRTDRHPDTGVVDMGYHYPLLDTVTVHLTAVPDSGVLPFTSQFSVTLGNVVAYHRTVAGRINLTLADGTIYQSWRAGYTNLGPNETYVTSWQQMLPALGSLMGENIFELFAEDVTPSPYNQPPYPPSGATATGACTVTGIAP